MGDEFEDFLNEEIWEGIQEKYPEYNINNAQTEEDEWEVVGGHCVEYYSWAGAEYEDRALNHPYESPWKAGFIVIQRGKDKKQVELTWRFTHDGNILKITKKRRVKNENINS